MNEIERDEEIGSRSYELMQAIGGTALSLLLAAGLGGWLLFDQGDAVPTGDPRHSSNVAIAPVAGSHDVNQGDPWIEPAFEHAPSVPAYYLVATQEHADAVLIGIYEAAAIRGSYGEPYLDERVIVLDSAEEESRFFLGLHEQDAVRGGMGISPLRIVDLRARRSRRTRRRRITSPRDEEVERGSHGGDR